jgi:hypothetical protein
MEREGLVKRIDSGFEPAKVIDGVTGNVTVSLEVGRMSKSLE